MKCGIQVSSLKPLLLTQAQVLESFAKIKALGCKVLQLQWVDPSVALEDIASALQENGLISVSVQDFYDLVRENPDYYIRLNELTGGTWLCVSRIPERLKSRAGLDTYICELRAMQRLLEPHKQKICFHPVSGDYAAVPGMKPVEYLLEHMPELEICLDLYHLNRNCTNMPGFIRRYGNRICMVHFKDALGNALVPAGQGDTNWEGVVSACMEAGIPYAFAEQEQWNRDPFECLKEALHWLNNEICNASP